MTFINLNDPADKLNSLYKLAHLPDSISLITIFFLERHVVTMDMGFPVTALGLKLNVA